ncbi:MAG: sugar phosphate isomerase/epimerase [Oscillospiraceae bacterium]|nr:sugar phosphate isomerase/epimerase [Oscillospiraceae bacterium]
MKLSIQLYSLRDMISTADDLLALFPKLKAMGFDGVEFAGYYDLSADVIRTALDNAGLVATGCHVPLEHYAPENLQATIDFHKQLGLSTIGIGGAPHSDPEDCAETCAILSQAYAEAQKQGITIYYHNHASEFMPFDDGTLPMDMLKQACALEVDTYWLHIADVDIYSFLMENAARVCHVHIKDGEGATPTALGEGDCDLHAVVRAAKTLNLEWLILEDETRHQGLDSVAKGMLWLKENV